MYKRLLVITAVGLFLLSTSGCMVTESAYLKKVEESDGFSKQLTELQQTHKKLSLDNAALKARFDTLTEDFAVLNADKKQLEGILRAKSDTLSKNISELRQQRAELKVENSTLSNEIGELRQQLTDLKSLNSKMTEDISALQKAKEEKIKEVDALRLQVAGLKAESSRTNDDIALLQKAKDEKIKEVSGTYEKLIADMKSEIAQGMVTVTELKGKLAMNMAAAVLFDSGKAEVKPGGREVLKKIIETLKNVNDKAIRVEGHTDVVQKTGGLPRTFPTNWELSSARAINVAKFLQKQGVDPRNLSAAAFAEHKPVADNNTKEGRARNRRIEITLVAKD